MPIDLFDWTKPRDLIRTGLAGAFSLVLLFYILTEINEMRHEGWDYWCGKVRNNLLTPY